MNRALVVTLLFVLCSLNLGCEVSNVLQECIVDSNLTQCTINMAIDVPIDVNNLDIIRNKRINLPSGVLDHYLKEGKLGFTLDNIYKVGDMYILKDIINPDCKILNFTIIYHLDPAYEIVKDSELRFPKKISFSKSGVHVYIRNSTKPFETMFAFRKKPYFLTKYLFVILGAIIMFLVYLVLTQKTEHMSQTHTEEKTIDKRILTLLTAEEEKIIDLLAKNENITQRELRNSTDFSPPKLTRLLNGLESRGILERETFGRTKILKLSKHMNFERRD